MVVPMSEIDIPDLSALVTEAIFEAEKTNAKADWRRVLELENELAGHAETEAEREIARRGAVLARQMIARLSTG